MVLLATADRPGRVGYVLGQMPTKHVIAMLNSVGAAQGADTLLSMPGDRIEVLMNEMTPAEVGRLLDGARTDRKGDLLAVIGPHRAPAILSRFTIHQLADLVSSLPLQGAVDLLRSMSPHAAADLLLEIPTQRRMMLQEVLVPSQPEQFTSAVYHREVEQSMLQIATRISWLDQVAGALLAEVMGRPFQIMVRHRPDASFTGDDLRIVASLVDWRRVVGAVVLTNAAPADSVAPAIRELRQYGQAIDVVRWHNDGDDGQFKRALVRLIS
jgi:hypothetical protein